MRASTPPHFCSSAKLGREFADWVPATIVRELRQGLSSRIFQTTFLLSGCVFPLWIVVQAAMLDRQTGTDSLIQTQIYFWVVLGLVLVVLVPLGGFSALEQECAGGALELVALAGVTSNAVVFAKWWAIVVQSLLVSAQVLPLLVMSYFLGGLETVRQVDYLSALLSLSAVAAAVVLFNSRFILVVRLVLFGVELVLGVFVLFVLGALFYYIPWAISFFTPLMLIISWYFTRELIAHPAEPIAKNKLLPALLAMIACFLPLVPWLRSGLIGLGVTLIFAWLWMQSERIQK